MKKIAITGGTGGLGQVVVPLLAKKYKLLLLVRDVEEGKRLFPKVELKRFDLQTATPAEIATAIKGCAGMVHLAGQVNLRGNAQELMKINASTTETVVRACEATPGLKAFVHASSIALYGWGNGPRDETSQLNPDSPYGRSKAKAEEVVRASKLNYVALRIGIIYGPHFLNVFKPMFKLMQKGQGMIIGDGRNTLPLVFEADVARAVDVSLAKLLAGNRQVARGAFNVVGYEQLNQRECLELIARQLNVPAPNRCISLKLAEPGIQFANLALGLVGKKTGLEPEHLRILAADRPVSVKKAAALLKFKASTSIQEGVRKMLTSEK